MKKLDQKLRQIQGKPYGYYQKLAGPIRFPFGTLKFEHIQTDPYAPFSRLLFLWPHQEAHYPADWVAQPVDRIGLGDFLARRLYTAFSDLAPQDSTGQGGRFRFPRPDGRIVERGSVQYKTEGWEIRFGVGLPSEGRIIEADSARTLLLDQLPWALQSSLALQESWKAEAQEHIDLYRDQLEHAQICAKKGLIAFIPNGALLPRASGLSELPMSSDRVIPFQAPESLLESFQLSSGRRVEGLGLKKGIHLITGGGFHGKSTLLQALSQGIYPHTNQDGRSFVYIEPASSYVMAKSGRCVAGTNVSPWINRLPSGIDSASFSTLNASGSTSQAAGVVEALQAGSKVLLMDEDTSAANYLVRNALMHQLLEGFSEPITPYIYRVKMLKNKVGVSTIIVASGLGDFLPLCDTVIALEGYKPQDLTSRAHELNKEGKAAPQLAEVPGGLGRKPGYKVLKTLAPKEKVRMRNMGSILLGEQILDAQDVEQIPGEGQWHYLASLLHQVYSTEKVWSPTELETLVREKLEGFSASLGEPKAEWEKVSYLHLRQLLSRCPLGCWLSD